MIEVSREGGFWRVCVNRPDKANSVTRAMLVDLAEVAEAAAGEAWPAGWSIASCLANIWMRRSRNCQATLWRRPLAILRQLFG